VETEAHSFSQVLEGEPSFYGIDTHGLLTNSRGSRNAEDVKDLTASGRLLGQSNGVFEVIGLLLHHELLRALEDKNSVQCSRHRDPGISQAYAY
jgi:hypothetical protein